MVQGTPLATVSHMTRCLGWSKPFLVHSPFSPSHWPYLWSLEQFRTVFLPVSVGLAAVFSGLMATLSVGRAGAPRVGVAPVGLCGRLSVGARGEVSDGLVERRLDVALVAGALGAELAAVVLLEDVVHFGARRLVGVGVVLDAVELLVDLGRRAADAAGEVRELEVPPERVGAAEVLGVVAVLAVHDRGEVARVEHGEDRRVRVDRVLQRFTGRVVEDDVQRALLEQGLRVRVALDAAADEELEQLESLVARLRVGEVWEHVHPVREQRLQIWRELPAQPVGRNALVRGVGVVAQEALPGVLVTGALGAVLVAWRVLGEAVLARRVEAGGDVGVVVVDAEDRNLGFVAALPVCGELGLVDVAGRHFCVWAAC